MNAAKMAALASRALGRGGGTALPGIIAERLDPSIARELADQLPSGSVLVTGTNGKTTTSRLLAGALREAGYRPVRNQSGSNLMRGVATSLVDRANLLGNLPEDRTTIGLFEVDEAALPVVLRSVKPRALLLLNLFRDQLDRYGEVATLARIWTGALSELPPKTSIVANADDPLVTESVLAAGCSPIFFGIEDPTPGSSRPEHASDVKACPRCGGAVVYTAISLGHLGHYSCPECDFRRPHPAISASSVDLHGVKGSRFELSLAGSSHAIDLPLPGLYNVYNALAAAAAAFSLGADGGTIASALAAATPAFGRMEQMSVEGRNVYLALAKNPAGLNEVIRTILSEAGGLHLLLMLNDNIADGHDVSWIWDADTEPLAQRIASVVFSGTRGPDMALRFKYAGAIADGAPPRWEVVDETAAALRRSIELTPAGHTLFVIPTYTALLEVRGVLTSLGHARPYWEE